MIKEFPKENLNRDEYVLTIAFKAIFRPYGRTAYTTTIIEMSLTFVPVVPVKMRSSNFEKRE